MINMQQLIEKYKAKLLKENEQARYQNEKINEVTNHLFIQDFSKNFQNIAEEINQNIGSKILSFQSEGKNRFIIEGKFHRVYFQKGKVEINNNILILNIIPICVWKGVTKHLGPISVYKNIETNETKWDITSDSPKKYAMNLFEKLIEDVDFSI